MSEDVKFKVEIPMRWLVAAPLKTIHRLESRLRGHDIWWCETFTRDTKTVEGFAPREIVTLLMACAQEHDVESILDALDAA